VFQREESRFAEVYRSHSSGLCDYINDAIMSILAELLEGNIGRVGIVLYTREDEDRSIQVREQYVLDVSTFHTEILDPNHVSTLSLEPHERRV
jgi:hypothetical protein